MKQNGILLVSKKSLSLIILLILLNISATAKEKGFMQMNNIVFKTVNNNDIKLNLYIPKTKINKKYPLLVWVHGGAWKRGSKDNIENKNPLLLSTVLKAGYALASVDYRLSGEASFPAPIRDINDSINFLYDNSSKFNIDVENIVVMGRSAGGHLASLVGSSNTFKDAKFYDEDKQPKYKVLSVVSFFGPTDILELSKKRIGTKGKSRKSPEAMLLGANPKDRPDLAKWASVNTYVSKKSPPFILLHGDEDTKVPVAQSILLKELLDKQGIDNKLFVEKGVGHSARVFDTDKYVPEVLSFVKKYLPVE